MALFCSFKNVYRNSCNSDIAEIDARLMQANSITYEYLFGTFNKLQNIINKNRIVIEDFSEIKQVVILSHSLYEVDAAYLKALFLQRSVATAQ